MSVWGFVCAHVLVCVVAKIDRLMPKRKFPEFCEGLPKPSRIKSVCVCACAVVGEDDCILEKERHRREGMDSQSGLCSDPRFKYHTVPAISP